MLDPRSKDKDIIRRLAEFVFLTSEQLAELTGRSLDMMWKRLRVLEKAGLVMRLDDPRSKYAPNGWCLTQKGWDLALELGFVEDEVDWEDDRSNLNLPHDLEITEFHLKLWRRFGDEGLYWRQASLRIYLPDGSFFDPDALFAVKVGEKWRAYFLEYERTPRAKQKNGQRARVEKVLRYGHYTPEQFEEEYGFPNWRMVMVVPGRKKAMNLMDEIAEHVEEGKFWFTPRQALAEDFFGRIWLTPHDHDTNAYSLVA